MRRSLHAGLLAVAVIGAMFAMPQTEARADGFIVIPHPPHPRPWPRPIRHPSYAPLAVKYHRVKVEINNLVAETHIDQVFHNPNNRQLEGTYIFPLEDDVAVKEFAMYMGGKKVLGEILDKDKARKIYEDIVRKMKDPALLEYMGTRMFKARVFPIPANGDVRIELKYSQVCPASGGLAVYRYPLNTEKWSSQPLKDVSVSVKLTSQIPLSSVYSPSHKIEVDRKDSKHFTIGWEDTNVKPDKDFLLYYAMSDKEFGLSLLTFRKGRRGPGYFMAVIAPAEKIKQARAMPKDIVFVVDKSGSMSGEKMEQAQKALKFCVNSLNKKDRFGIIKFGSEVTAFEGKMLPAAKANIKDARGWIDEIVAVGTTNISGALTTALKMLGDTTKGRPRMIVFITDGKPTEGITDVKELLKAVGKANEARTRIFVFGVGYRVNTQLLDKLAGDNYGTQEYVDPKEDLEAKVSNFYTQVASPVLSDLKLVIPGATDIYPRRLTDLFKGSQLTIFGRYKKYGDQKVVLSGKRGGKKVVYKYEGDFGKRAKRNDFLPRLWAQRKIGHLLTQVRLNGETKEAKDTIVALSKKYGIMTPYTSFLVREDTRHRVAGGEPLSGPTRALDKAISTTPGAPRAEADARQGFGGTTGGGAVQASQALKRMAEAGKLRGKDGGYLFGDNKGDLGLKDRAGRMVITTVAGKTFYRDGEVLIDSTYDGKSEKVKVKQFSKEYFDLLAKNSDLGKWFALGKVIVAYDGVVYETVMD